MEEIPHHDITHRDENTSLIRTSMRRRYNCTRSCVHVVPRSKAAGLILLWYFIVALSYGVALNPDVYLGLFGMNMFIVCAYAFNAVLLIFYPLSGFLADVRFGRYKTVVRSIWLVFSALLIIIVAATIGGVGAGVPIALIPDTENTITLILMIVFLLIGSIFGLIAVIFLLVGFTGFHANVIQFGVDQLHDTPVGDTSLFIHWYVVLFYLSTAIAQLLWSPISFIDSDIAVSIPASFGSIIALFLFFIMPISLCLGYRRRHWFLIEPGQRNPYKLVYKVVKFAIKHKHPVDRSAFTYCEDEFPSRMDLGKDKYGGPFSTEQVEDVKAFFGILQILFALGPFFAVGLYSSAFIQLVGLDPYFSLPFEDEPVNDFLPAFNRGSLASIAAVAFISVYIFVLRPFISHRIPSMLKRIGLRMIVLLISLLCIFSVNTTEMVTHNDPICTLDSNNISLRIKFEPPSVSTTMLVLANVSSALANVLIYIATFEFICAQAPYSMKGLLIGLFFAIKGVFQLVGIGIGAPFVLWSSEDDWYIDLFSPIVSYGVCGFGYYLIVIIIALISLAVYIWVAKRYKFRQRDEPSHLHRYAEEYYSNIQQERHYDD